MPFARFLSVTRSSCRAFSKSAVNEGVSNGRVEGGGAEGFGDVGGSGEAVDADGQVAEGGHELGALAARTWAASSSGMVSAPGSEVIANTCSRVFPPVLWSWRSRVSRMVCFAKRSAPGAISD